MADRAVQYRRTHNLLLMQRLLSFRENTSPFVLVLDSIEQSGKPLLIEYIERAKSSRSKIIFVSYDTVVSITGVDTFINGRRKSAASVQTLISSAVSKDQKSIIIFDTLHPLASDQSVHLPNYLSSLIAPQVSLLAVYHLDVPLEPRSSTLYSPSSLTLLKYLATTILTVHSLAQILARKRAADKSLQEPTFGLAEEMEGIVAGFGGNDPRGVILEMEYRRKSGRGVCEWFFLPTSSLSQDVSLANPKTKEKVILLEDHPLYKQHSLEVGPDVGEIGNEDSTFSLGLTQKQRLDREGVVLPYMDAQKDGGGGGGRILYDMGIEDDFDEEEDEI